MSKLSVFTGPETDYGLLPEHLRDGMKRYLELGILPGHCLQAVICNDFIEAFKRADDIVAERMRDIAAFFYNEVPGNAWGNKEKMLAWSKELQAELAHAEVHE